MASNGKTKKQAPIIVTAEMPFTKATKNTFKFDVDSAENSPIRTIYVEKFGFGKGVTPKKVAKITVEWE